MHVHDYEKLWLGLSLVLIVLLIGTITYGAVAAGITMVGSEDEDVIDQFDEGPGVYEAGPGEYDVYVESVHPVFQPMEIVVPADSTVTFYITSVDVIHGFQIERTNVNTMVIPGEVATVTMEVGERDEREEYGIVCNEYCGPRHHDMEAKLVIVPEDEFEGGENA